MCFLSAILSATKEEKPEINDFGGFVLAGVGQSESGFETGISVLIWSVRVQP